MPVKDVSTIEFDPRTLESALKDADLTQSAFSAILGYPHRNTVNKIIRSKRTVSATELLRFATVLNKDPNDFIKKD